MRHKPRQYLAISKTWVERYLTIFNDNLAIFDDRNVHTGARKLSPKRYRQISSFIVYWEPSLRKFSRAQVNIGYIHPKIKQELESNVQLFHRFLIMLDQIDISAMPNKYLSTVWMDNTIRPFAIIDCILIILIFYLGIGSRIKGK